jgi:hypothetical protein
MFGTILSFITGKWGAWCLLIAAGVAIWLLTQNLVKAKAEVEQKSEALQNSNFQIKRDSLKNGQLEETVTALQVNGTEFSKMNQGLAGQIAAMGIKVAQLQSATNIIAHQSFRIDTLNSHRDTSRRANSPIDTGKWNGLAGVYNTSWKDRWASFSASINLNRGRNPFLTGIVPNFRDSLIIANETKRKRVWLFFHKVTGVLTHITSPSPYFKVDTVQNYIITK